MHPVRLPELPHQGRLSATKTLALEVLAPRTLQLLVPISELPNAKIGRSWLHMLGKSSRAHFSASTILALHLLYTTPVLEAF